MREGVELRGGIRFDCSFIVTLLVNSMNNPERILMHRTELQTKLRLAELSRERTKWITACIKLAKRLRRYHNG